MKHGILLAVLSGAVLLCLGAPAVAEVLFQDEHGVRVEYRAIDTGQSTSCSGPPETDINHSTKKIKVWKISLSITNGSNRRIKPNGTEIAHVNVEPDQGSSLGYCAYERLPNFHKIDGHGDQVKFMFGIAWGVFAIPPGRTISNSTYMYLYEDQRPARGTWTFSGYVFLDDTSDDPSTSGPSPATAPTPPTGSGPPNVSDPVASKPEHAERGPSGSLLLLMDVSGSMSGRKLDSARQAAVDTIRKAVRNNTEIAVLAFEGDCASPIHRSVGFSQNDKELIAFVNSLEALGGTPLASALDATNRFMEQHKATTSKSQMVLLLADGDDNCGNLDTVLDTLKQKNLLYRHETVGLEVSGAAQQQLQNIAARSGGNYHSASSQNLAQVFADAVELMRMLDMIGKFR